jgi:hypothetical protein
MKLAQDVRSAVLEQFGVELEIEPVVISDDAALIEASSDTIARLKT